MTDSNSEYTPSDAALELEKLFTSVVNDDDLPEGEDEFDSEDSTESDMAPDEDRISQEDEEESEPAEPTIVAPRSWNADEQTAFNNLPRDVQQIISTRETERDNVTKQTLNQTAENRKAYEAEVSRMQGLQQQNLQNVNALAAMILPEIQQLRQTDWDQLATYDPTEWTRLKQVEANLVGKWNGLKNQYDNLVNEQRKSQDTALGQRINEQLLLAYEAIPDFNYTQDASGQRVFKDQAKANALDTAMQQTFKDYNFTDADALALYSDARMVKALARLAHLESREAARTTAQGKRQAPQAPRLSAPSSSTAPQGGKESRGYKAAMDRLKETGSARDAAAALAARFN